MKISLSENIRSDFEGYDGLIGLYHKLKDIQETKIEIDFHLNNWFEANLSAVFGAVIDLIEEKGKKITLLNIKPKLAEVFRRNLFLCQCGFPPLPDKNETVITYQKFSPDEDTKFMDYIKNELLSKSDFPKHSKMLGKKINESIFELFENARTHGHCAYTYTCGQYYPGKSPKRLDITIVDMGKTIKANVNKYLNKNLTGPEAIVWALQYGNTTKTGNISGGLGLDLILEFIKLNNGKIQIISSDGYWEYRRGPVKTKIFDKPFLGTIVNIEFNLDDRDYYKLKEEISLDDIF